MNRIAAPLSLMLSSLLLVGQAMAHSMPHSTVAVDVSATSISVESDWPLEELELALPSPLSATGDKLTEAQQRFLIDYGSRHVWIEQLDGKRWPSEKEDVRLELNDGHRQIIYRAVYRRPQNITSPAARLHYDAITHEVMSHAAMIYTQVHSGDTALEQSVNPVAVIQNPTTGVDLKLADPQIQGLTTNLIGGLAAALLAAAVLVVHLLWKRILS